MSVSRSLCLGFISIAVVGALRIPGARIATPCAVPPPAATGDVGAADGDEPPPFEPVAPVSSLMAGLASALDAMHEVLPKTEDEGRLGRVATWSEVIAELSNVHTRHRREPEYLEMAADTRSIALAIARGARAETPDEGRLGTLVDELESSCKRCHDVDW